MESVQFLGGKENVFAVTLGRRFQQLKATEQDAPPRLVLEFQAPPLPAASPHRAGRPRSRRRARRGLRPPAEPPVVRTVVIDPGHGGEEVGAKGPGGTLEKDVTLAIARKLRAQIVNSLGYQVFLTRDNDVELALDERTAIANNYKADLFLSIHANASRSHGARPAARSTSSPTRPTRRAGGWRSSRARLPAVSAAPAGLGPRPDPLGHGAGRAPRGVLRPRLPHPGGAGGGDGERGPGREAGALPSAGGRGDARRARGGGLHQQPRGGEAARLRRSSSPRSRSRSPAGSRASSRNGRAGPRSPAPGPGPPTRPVAGRP